MEAQDPQKTDKMTDRCWVIVTLNPIVMCVSLEDAPEAYLVRTLLTTPEAHKASCRVMQKGQRDYKYLTSSASA